MLYSRQTTGSVEEVCRRVEEATKASQFGVLGTIPLTEKIRAKGVDFAPQCAIVEVCNPAVAKTVLEANMSIATALPCRIAVYEDGDAVTVATMRPTAILAQFGTVELEPVAQLVEDTVIRIIDAACG